MIVMKFGGTSVGSGERMAAVARLVRDWMQENGNVPPVVVTSAMSGVTDSLRSAAREAAGGHGDAYRDMRAVLSRRHKTAIETAISDPDRRDAAWQKVSDLLDLFENLCGAVHILGELTARGLDVISGLGERLSVPILAASLEEIGVKAVAIEATDLVVTDDQHGDAHPLFDQTAVRTRQVLSPTLEEGTVPVVTGYIGATVEGVPTTLGRGASDYTATILGRCLEAEEVWIWTDVDGVMTADPRIVKDARSLPRISYAEVAELAYFGAKVIHPMAIRPAVEISIPVRVVNTFHPTHPGTVIDAEGLPGVGVKGITAIRGLSLVTVEGRGMLGVPGVAARVFAAVAGCGASVLMISQSSSEQSICFVVRKADADPVIQAMEGAFSLELMRRDIDRIGAQANMAIIAVVGAGMRGMPGIAHRVFGALAQESINIVSIAQGSSEYNLSLVVEESDANDAVQAIHTQFGLGEEARDG